MHIYATNKISKRSRFNQGAFFQKIWINLTQLHQATRGWPDRRLGEQGGTLPVINRVITSASRVYNPSYQFIRPIYRGYNPIYNW